MEEDNVTIVLPQNSSIIPLGISGRTRLNNGNAGVCPLCDSKLRLFFINFNEKLLMCENTLCEFPFGHEDLQVFRDDNDTFFDDELRSVRSSQSRGSLTEFSTVSTSAWSDIQKLNKIMDTDDSLSEKPTRQQDETLKYKQRTDTQLKKALNDMKQLNNELASHTIEDERKYVKIKNEKWIKNLKTLQDVTGAQLLKPSEMIRLPKAEPVIGLGELKIDINQGDSDGMSCIKIEISNNSMEIEDLQKKEV